MLVPFLIMVREGLEAALGRMTAEALALPVARHDPEAHYAAVRRKWIGFDPGTGVPNTAAEDGAGP